MAANHFAHFLKVQVEDMNNVVRKQALCKWGESSNISKEDQDILFDPDGTRLNPFNVNAVDLRISPGYNLA